MTRPPRHLTGVFHVRPHAGLRGLGGAEPDLRKLSVDVKVHSPDGAAAVRRIAEAWQQRCPIYLALVKPTDVDVRFRSA